MQHVHRPAQEEVDLCTSCVKVSVTWNGHMTTPTPATLAFIKLRLELRLVIMVYWNVLFKHLATREKPSPQTNMTNEFKFCKIINFLCIYFISNFLLIFFIVICLFLLIFIFLHYLISFFSNFFVFSIMFGKPRKTNKIFNRVLLLVVDSQYTKGKFSCLF